jgi:hypothetical protein
LTAIVDEFTEYLNDVAYPNEKCDYRGSEAVIVRHIPATGKNTEWTAEIRLTRITGRGGDAPLIVPRSQLTYDASLHHMSILFY